tara:strand:- start:761 stop:1159 length:399 start_codon:yes stop_codon:yes gene_type:complete
MHKGKKPDGMTIIIAVGGGKPPLHGRSNKDKKGKGCEMIKLPMEALVSEDEVGEGVTPEVGDAISLDAVEGEVTAINDDGTVHVELMSAGGVPIEYVEHVSEGTDVEEVDDLAEEEAELLAAVAEEDEKRGF